MLEFRLGSLHPHDDMEFEQESSASEMWTSEGLGRWSAGLGASIVFSFLFGATGTAAVTWVTCFFGGAMSIVGGCLEEGYWVGRDPSMDS